jgi:hypothetical protein
MAPSAMASLVTQSSKTLVSEAPETHVHGAEDKTPLEAISHGPLIQPGMYEGLFYVLRCVDRESIIRLSCSLISFMIP